jgi:hydroxyacylglutathione hydrolase
MAIDVVPQLLDNFAYLVVDETTRECAVVDCAEADKVIAAARGLGVSIVAVLTTHWHPDHSGGNLDLTAKLKGLRIYGASAENGRIPGLTHPVANGDTIHIGMLEARVIGIPAHTSGHVAYYFAKLEAVFTGDTLFIGGCGRVFEGNAATMVASLGRLAALPDSTRVYCGHEYTEKNLRFALTLEPHNAALKASHEAALRARADGKWTVPSTIGDEKKINPFLRTDSAELRASLKRIDPSLSNNSAAIFAKVRQLKDSF